MELPPSCINYSNPGSLQGRSFIQSVISCLVFTRTLSSSSHHLSSPVCFHLQHPPILFFFFFCRLHLYACSALDQHFCTLGMTFWKDPAEYRCKRKHYCMPKLPVWACSKLPFFNPIKISKNVNKVSLHVSANWITTKHSPMAVVWYEEWGLHLSQKSEIW